MMEQTEGKPLLPSCLDNCLYMAPLSDKKGKVWCARKGKYINALIVNVMGGWRCNDYRERK